MRKNSFQLALSVGFIALCAWTIPACGDDDEGGGSGGTGGTGATGGGGTGGGGTGGTAGGAAGAAGGGAVTCGGDTCMTYKVGGIINLGACCTNPGDACGSLIDATISGLVGLPEGCYEPQPPKAPDANCDGFPFTNPLDGGAAEFPGCCRDDGQCGYAVDISSTGGPNFGCIKRPDGSPTQACTGGSDGGTAGAGGGSAGAPADAGTD